MEKVTDGLARESEERAEAKRRMDLLAELEKAVSQLREITNSYAEVEGVSELLINRLCGLERRMMDELNGVIHGLLDRFYKAVPVENAGARPKRKSEKQAVPVPKVGT